MIVGVLKLSVARQSSKLNTSYCILQGVCQGDNSVEKKKGINEGYETWWIKMFLFLFVCAPKTYNTRQSVQKVTAAGIQYTDAVSLREFAASSV